MEWNFCWGVNTVTPFLIESTGDSDEVIKSHGQDESSVMDESEGGLFRFDSDNNDDDEDDDDARSCSYDHSSYIKTRHDHNSGQMIHDHQSQGVGVYDDGDGEMDDDDDDGDEGNSKCCDGNLLMMDSYSKHQKKRSYHKFCVDSSNQKEIDRRFWEACLAS